MPVDNFKEGRWEVQRQPELSSFTVCIYVARIHEKLFLGSDDGLCCQKNRQIQCNQGFFIWTVAFWEIRDFLIKKSFYFPCYFFTQITLERFRDLSLNIAMMFTFVNPLCQLMSVISALRWFQKADSARCAKQIYQSWVSVWLKHLLGMSELEG